MIDERLLQILREINNFLTNCWKIDPKSIQEENAIKCNKNLSKKKSK